MSLLRWLSRISIAEWLLIGLALAWLIRRPAAHTRAPGAAAPPAPGAVARPWAIDACVALTVIGVLGGAIVRLQWLSLLGFGSAALGLALALRAGALRAKLAARRWFGRQTRR